jgi:hypothetical protein
VQQVRLAGCVFARDDLIASHGADYPMPNLLDHLAAPSCSRLGSNWVDIVSKPSCVEAVLQ